MEKRKMTIAVYIRLSREDADKGKRTGKQESVSIMNQRNYIQAYISSREEFKGAGQMEFVDDGYSGTNFNRPSVQKMLRMCRNREVDCVIVKDISRFGRSYLEVGGYLDQIFPCLGIRFIAVNDHYDSADYRGTTGGIDVAFRNFFYDAYSRDLSEKVKSGVFVSMKKGEYHAGWIVYGYRKSEDGRGLAVDENAAAVVRRIFEEIAAGKTSKNVARQLNEEGIPTVLAYKQAMGEQKNRQYEADIWNGGSITKMIRNEVYQGDMVYKKAVRPWVGSRTRIRQPQEAWTVIRDHHEPVVGRELFRKANERVMRKKAPDGGQKRAGRGVVRCSCCKRTMELRKTRTPYFVCRRRGLLADSLCNEITIPQKRIEETMESIRREYGFLTGIRGRKVKTEGLHFSSEQTGNGLVEKVLVYGEDRIEIVWKYEDVFIGVQSV